MVEDLPKLTKRIRWLGEIIQFLGDYARSLQAPNYLKSFTETEKEILEEFIKLMDDCQRQYDLIDKALQVFFRQLKAINNPQSKILDKDKVSFLEIKNIRSHEADKVEYPAFEFCLVHFLREAHVLYNDYRGEVPLKMDHAFKTLHDNYSYRNNAIPHGLKVINSFLIIHTQWRIDTDDWFYDQYKHTDAYDNWLSNIEQGIYAQPPISTSTKGSIR